MTAHALKATVLQRLALRAPARRLRLVEPAPEAAWSSAHVLTVTFASPDGRRWTAVGGGETVEDAIAFAYESCPAGADWRAVGISDLYGA
jgi:hypothetical protein